MRRNDCRPDSIGAPTGRGPRAAPTNLTCGKLSGARCGTRRRRSRAAPPHRHNAIARRGRGVNVLSPTSGSLAPIRGRHRIRRGHAGRARNLRATPTAAPAGIRVRSAGRRRPDHRPTGAHDSAAAFRRSPRCRRSFRRSGTAGARRTGSGNVRVRAEQQFEDGVCASASCSRAHRLMRQAIAQPVALSPRASSDLRARRRQFRRAARRDLRRSDTRP